MKHPWIYRILIAFALISAVAALFFTGISVFYRDSFSVGTWINGIYCTGKTADETNELLKRNFSYDGLKISDSDGSELLYIKPTDCGMTVDYSDELNKIMEQQDPTDWPFSFMTSRIRNITPAVSLDRDMLDAYLEKSGILTKDTASDVSIGLSPQGLRLYDTVGAVPDAVRMKEAASSALYTLAGELVFDDTYYAETAYTADEQAVIEQYETLKDQLSADITYVMGEDTERVYEPVLAGFLLKDENGGYVQDETTGEYAWDDRAIEAWVDSLADKYDTVGITRTFKTTSGLTVEIKGGTYGNLLDRNAEKKYLKNAVKNKISEKHEPEYKQKAYCQGINDIGDTYIEVNMTDQMLYYYKNGRLVLDTPVVTGNMMLGRDTPDGVNYVYYMQKNRTLHGDNYTSFVKYWIAVKGHIGIHDASWRDEYGGDIYKTGGSHGCINTPLEKVSRLYDMVEIGTPAVMFYTE